MLLVQLPGKTGSPGHYAWHGHLHQRHRLGIVRGIVCSAVFEQICNIAIQVGSVYGGIVLGGGPSFFMPRASF